MRAHEPLRQMCVKPADRTTPSPPKTSARPRTATRPSRALPLPHAVPTHARRLHDTRPQAARCIPRRPHNPFPVEGLCPPPLSDTPAPTQRHALLEHFRSPTQRRRTPAGCAMHARRPYHPFPAAPPCPPLRSASGTKKRHRTVHVRCRMSRSTVVAVGHLGW